MRGQIDFSKASLAYQAAQLVIAYILEILVSKLAGVAREVSISFYYQTHACTCTCIYLCMLNKVHVYMMCTKRKLTPATPGTSWQASISEHAGLAPWWWPACVAASSRHMAPLPGRARKMILSLLARSSSSSSSSSSRYQVIGPAHLAVQVPEYGLQRRNKRVKKVVETVDVRRSRRRCRRTENKGGYGMDPVFLEG